jgi:hypothetical protein
MTTEKGTRMRAIAKKVWELETDMTPSELILFADGMLHEIGDQLDSLDLGDALGAMVSIAESDEYSGNLEHGNISRWHENGKYCILSFSYDLFKWEGIPEGGNTYLG